MRVAFGWVRHAAHILNNEEQREGSAVRSALRGLLGAMSRHRQAAGSLEPAVAHFLKVSRSYWPGLFHCYDVKDLPRTNNDLEQFFGAGRYHERRATGRKGASPALVLRGSVRLMASAATRIRPYTAQEIAPRHLQAWQLLRTSLDSRRHTRVLRCRFRRNPAAYLANLEARLLKLSLRP